MKLLGISNHIFFQRKGQESVEFLRQRVICPHEYREANVTAAIWLNANGNWTPRAVINCSVQQSSFVSCDMSCLTQFVPVQISSRVRNLEDIARSMFQALHMPLSLQKGEAIASKPAEKAQAYECYQRAQSYVRRCTHSDLGLAIEMYERAIALEPNFALAYAGLGIACALVYEWHEKDHKWIQRATAATERAMALEPDLAEALAARARIAWSQEKYQDAADYALRAITRKSNCEHAYWILGQAYFTLDRLEELAEVAERALESSGADYNVYVPIYLGLERLGKKEAAQRVRRQQTRALQQHLEQVPEDVRAHIMLAGNHASFGNESEAIQHVQTAMALRPGDSNVLYNAACTYGILCKKREALELLRKARDAGFTKISWAARDTDLACLHGDPEFKQLLEMAKSKG